MNQEILSRLPGLLDLLGIEDPPMGIYYADAKPEEGFAPRPMDLPTRERESKNEIDWKAIFDGFSCVMGNIWRARKKQTAAYFSAERFGCPGGGFWLGFLKPQTETIIHYVSSGIPGQMKGEHYCESPDELRRIFDAIDPRPAPKKYCIVKPLKSFRAFEEPEVVVFFSRPEALCGLHQLAAFVTNDPEAVASPWSAACGSLVIWPIKYRQAGRKRAVVGGWDPSARKFFKTDELSFSVPFDMFCDMVERYDQSFLTTATWTTVRKKVDRSRKAWGEKS
jgi:uncharacterized protein (DUF169 family)